MVAPDRAQTGSTTSRPRCSVQPRSSKLAALPSTSRARKRYVERVSYYGQQGRLDSQARIVIPPILRNTAGMEGEVLVFGSIDYLEIWNREVFESKLADDPFSDEDFAALADGGI